MNFLALYQSLPTIGLFVFFAIIIGLAAYFMYAYKKEEEFAELERENLADYEKILMRAHKEAQAVFKKASQKAQKMLEKTTDFDRDALASLTKKLQEETNRMVEEYHNNLTATSQGESETLKHAAEDLEKITEKEIHAYTESLQKTLIVSQDKINQELSQDVAKAKEEIAAYKTEQFAKADGKIKELINKIALQVLGKSLSLEDQEKLIVESLEQAKKEGLFA